MASWGHEDQAEGCLEVHGIRREAEKTPGSSKSRCNVPVVGRRLRSKRRLSHGHVAGEGTEAGKQGGEIRLRGRQQLNRSVLPGQLGNLEGTAKLCF